MTDSSEKREDVVYVYVNSFEYKQDKFKEMMGGHPHSGRVYRAFYDKESELYRILFDDTSETRYTGLVVKNLINEDSRWSANMEILDDDTILQKDVQPEDYRKLSHWKEVNNEDIAHLRIEQSTEVEALPDNGVTKIVFSKAKDNISPEEAGINNLKLLFETDPDIGAGTTIAMQGILSYLESCSPTEPDLTKAIGQSPTHGKGVNCGIAIEALTEYLHNDSYLASGTLTKAVYYLLREIARINKEVND